MRDKSKHIASVWRLRLTSLKATLRAIIPFVPAITPKLAKYIPSVPVSAPVPLLDLLLVLVS